MKSEEGDGVRVRGSGLRWKIVGSISRGFVPGRVAVTIGRTIFIYRDPLPDGVMDHEKIHVLQFEREGVRMAVKYVWYYVRGWIRFRDRREAYLRNPYEVEARRESATV